MLRILASLALAALGIAVILTARQGMLAQVRAWEQANRALNPQEAAWGRFAHLFGMYWYIPAAVWLLACLGLACWPRSSVDKNQEFQTGDTGRQGN